MIGAHIEHKPFNALFISKPELDLPQQADKKRKHIKKSISSFNSPSKAKAQYLYHSQRNGFKSRIDPFKTIQVKKESSKKCAIPSLKSSLSKPKVVLSYCDPYDFHRRERSKKLHQNRTMSKSIQVANCFRTVVNCPMRTEDTYYDDRKELRHRERYPNKGKKGCVKLRGSIKKSDLSPYFDSELISEIGKEKKSIDAELERIKAKRHQEKEKEYSHESKAGEVNDEENALTERNGKEKDTDIHNKTLSSYVTFNNNYQKLFLKKKRNKASGSVIPRESNRYKVLDFKKECIFNNEYNTIYSNKPQQYSHHLFIAPSVSLQSNNITKQFSSISRNLRTINKTMIQDKKYSLHCLKGELKKRNRKEFPEKALINREIRKERFIAVEIENRGLKEKCAIDILGHLKEVLQIRTKKEPDPLSKTLDSTIAKFFKKGNFGAFLPNRSKRNYYDWKLKRNEESHKEVKSALKTIEDNNYKIRYIQRQIKSIDTNS